METTHYECKLQTQHFCCSKKIQAVGYNGAGTVVMLVLTDPCYLRNTSATDKNKIHKANI